MAKLKISSAFRARFSEKLMDLGNFVAAGLVIGQFVSGKELSMELLFAGFIGTLTCYLGAYLINP